MNIGVLWNNLSQEAGGAFSFELTLLESLQALSKETEHQFFIYGWSQEPPSINDFSLPYKSLSDAFQETLEKKIIRRFQSLVVNARDNRSEKFIRESLKANGIQMTWSLSFGSLSFDTPYIATVLDLEYKNQPYFPEVSDDGEWDRRESYYNTLLPRAAAVIVPADSTKSQVTSYFGVDAERIHVIAHPAPIVTASDSTNSAGIREKHGLTEPYFLYPAQFWPHKNHITLLRALKILAKETELTPKLVLCGSDQGNLDHVKAEVLQLGLEQQVVFLGFISSDELRNLYKHAIALVYLSLFGPQNLPPLEAFVYECPVVAADIPGVKEHLGNGALLVDPLNETLVAQSLESLLTNADLRKDLARRAKNQKCLSWTGINYVESVLDIISSFERKRRLWP